MGRLIGAYRHHPHHGTPIPQTVVARWASLTQAQISRLERQAADQQLDRLAFWARLLRIPKDLLWFVPTEGEDVLLPPPDVPRLAAGADRLYRGKESLADIGNAEETDVRRRVILGSLVAAVASPFGAAPGGESATTFDLDQTAAVVAKVRRAYQHGCYGQALRDLPSALTALSAVAQTISGDALLAVLTAEAYQVASGLLLKSDEPSLAAVAAERSIAAARASGEPLAVASSVRAVVHGLLAAGHPAQAAEVAATAAARLADDVGMRSQQELSVYGALLLRGAIAAARAEQRERAGALLNEAATAARHVGIDGNARWTAFSATNVLAHRVAAAVELGDAGTAVSLAQTVDLQQMAVPERRAVLLLDTARALTQWGRYERALEAIRAAEGHAPEEVRSRRPIRQLISDLGRRCPAPLQRRVHEYAMSVGAPV
ncbi:hypothetical protein ACFO1B_39745 [Dactylosporangium siamense]|uniref:Uncharacterized protein n=1 Tax=Dactylosporangium siamense TaxID=685454 RepID=A0A919PTH8_9ACTN|nr:hypothetical protein [Dactylosporangium siamense]GIG49927.1 hypothetical protein Dsi01nite_079680 [Dactylosporangium siamense]